MGEQFRPCLFKLKSTGSRRYTIERMRRSEDHAAGKLDWPGADLADETGPVIEPLDSCCRRRFKVREDTYEFTVMEQGPLMTVLCLKFGLHAIEGGDVVFEVGHRTISTAQVGP
jgi:hypothetical protein